MFRRNILKSLLFFSLAGMSYGIYYTSEAFPIAAGYGAKVMCSALFVSGRDEKVVKAEDLHFFPLTLASFTINRTDSTVTCSMPGFGKAKAIHRAGMGSTLVNDLSEGAIRNQRYRVPASPAMDTDTIPWPMGDKTGALAPSGIDARLVNDAVDEAFQQRDESFVNITRAVLVMYDGQIVAERYAEGYSRHTRLGGWSMAKSVTSAIVGLLVKDGRLQVDAPAPVPEWTNASDPRQRITLKHLLQQTSGLDFKEVYDKPADANRMLFTRGDAAAYAASIALNRTPGTHFRYSSGNSNIISRICRQAIGENDYHAFPYQRLFYTLGMYHTVLEPDASGTFVGSSFCFATLRDWARFGLLYLQNGRWNGEQLLPENWVQLSTRPSGVKEQGDYGLQWWLNTGRKYPNVPADMYFADGFEGQNIFIIPSKKLVIVRLGLTRRSMWGEQTFLPAVIGAVK